MILWLFITYDQHLVCIDPYNHHHNQGTEVFCQHRGTLSFASIKLHPASSFFLASEITSLFSISMFFFHRMFYKRSIQYISLVSCEQRIIVSTLRHESLNSWNLTLFLASCFAFLDMHFLLSSHKNKTNHNQVRTWFGFMAFGENFSMLFMGTLFPLGKKMRDENCLQLGTSLL